MFYKTSTARVVRPAPAARRVPVPTPSVSSLLDAAPAAPAAASPPPAPDPLLEILRDTDVPCPVCQYNLRAAARPQCPECGTALTLKLVLGKRPVPLSGAWVATIVSLSAGLVESLPKWRELVTYYHWPAYAIGHAPPFEDWEIALKFASGLYWLGPIPLLVLLLAYRRAFCRLPRWVQWWAASAFIVLAVLGHRRMLM